MYPLNLTALRLKKELVQKMEQQYHHGDLKMQLIKAGLDMIQEEGIGRVSLRKLAQRCKVSEAAPYSHFKNKEDLLTTIQEYVAEQLQDCIKAAYEKTEHSDRPEAILNMGKAYVLFFIQYPEYYFFLFSQAGLKIDLSMPGDEKEFAPFRYYKEKAYLVYRRKGISEERIKYGVIAMWAKVHGLAAIASMQGIVKDFEWEAVLDKILVE